MAISSTYSVILKNPVLLTGQYENLIQPLRHSEERIGRRENLIHPLRHSEERIVRRENLIQPLRHSEERIVRRENLILYNYYKKEPKR